MPHTDFYTLSLHDALPILEIASSVRAMAAVLGFDPLSEKWAAAGGDDDKAMHALGVLVGHELETDRKSTRLNSSHVSISYAVFCLKKKKLSQVTNVSHAVL